MTDIGEALDKKAAELRAKGIKEEHMGANDWMLKAAPELFGGPRGSQEKVTPPPLAQKSSDQIMEESLTKPSDEVMLAVPQSSVAVQIRRICIGQLPDVSRTSLRVTSLSQLSDAEALANAPISLHSKF